METTIAKDLLLGDRDGGVLALALNRPGKRNALHPDLVSALQGRLSAAATDPGINVVELSAVGPSFCAGVDLGELDRMDAAGKRAYIRSVHGLFEQLYFLPQPIVAVVDGPAIAGGFDLAAFCDLRLCSPKATFGQAEITLGLTQLLYPLYKIVGLGRAKELALTGGPIRAPEAHRIGLVNRIFESVELAAAARRFCQELAAKDRKALIETKRLAREVTELPSKQAFAEMERTLLERFLSPEHERLRQRFLLRPR